MSEERPQHPGSLPKAQKKQRGLLASSRLRTMRGHRRMTGTGPSSIHRSRLRGPKRLRKPLVPNEPGTTAR